MTVDEAKEAFRRGVPVVHDGIEYREISALITRRDVKARKYVLTVELLDKSGRAVVIAPPDKVRLVRPLVEEK